MKWVGEGLGVEEAVDVVDVVGAGVGGEGFEEGFAVAGGADAGVEEHEDAAVGEGADEAAEALFEGDDGLRDLEVVEGVAAGGGDGVGAGLHDGVGGDGEGELVDDDAGELLALDVDALPEGGGAEEDGVGGVAELLEEDVARGGALHHERVGELGQQAVVELAHLGVGGEEAEGAAASDFQDAADLFGGLREEVGVAGLRHVGREVEQGLAGVVEVGGDDELSGEGDAEAFLEVVEGGLAFGIGDGEGGGGEDDGGVVGEEGFGEEGGDVDGCGLEVGGEGLRA